MMKYKLVEIRGTYSEKQLSYLEHQLQKQIRFFFDNQNLYKAEPDAIDDTAVCYNDKS